MQVLRPLRRHRLHPMLSAQMASADDVVKAEMMATKAGWLTMHGLVLADSGDHKAAVALHSEAIEADANVTSAWSNRASSHEANEPVNHEGAVAEDSHVVVCHPHGLRHGRKLRPMDHLARSRGADIADILSRNREQRREG